MKERLDVILVEQGYATSREKAKAIIMSGNVYVNGQKEDKAGTGFDVSKIKLEVRDHTMKYVSRGGLKLEKAITEEIRKGHRIDTTTKLRQVIEQTLSFLPENKEKKDIIRKTCQRTFQALRIDVNHEFEVLYEFMEKLPGTLKPGGRVAILTFHSGEDKLVKKALKAGYREGVYSEYAKDVVRPSAEECAQNGRARSTKMRWAVKAE